MDLSEFVIWKFRTVDGVAEHWNASEVFLSKYRNNNGDAYDLAYNHRTRTCSLLQDGKVVATFSFDDCQKELERRGLWFERLHDRHKCSYKPKEEI